MKIGDKWRVIGWDKAMPEQRVGDRQKYAVVQVRLTNDRTLTCVSKPGDTAAEAFRIAACKMVMPDLPVQDMYLDEKGCGYSQYAGADYEQTLFYKGVFSMDPFKAGQLLGARLACNCLDMSDDLLIQKGDARHRDGRLVDFGGLHMPVPFGLFQHVVQQIVAQMMVRDRYHQFRAGVNDAVNRFALTPVTAYEGLAQQMFPETGGDDDVKRNITYFASGHYRQSLPFLGL
ncbi:MAG: hypothetical protein AB7G06_09700 [Bdellovibrionales bacterium]